MIRWACNNHVVQWTINVNYSDIANLDNIYFSLSLYIYIYICISGIQNLAIVDSPYDVSTCILFESWQECNDKLACDADIAFHIKQFKQLTPMSEIVPPGEWLEGYAYTRGEIHMPLPKLAHSAGFLNGSCSSNHAYTRARLTSIECFFRQWQVISRA